MYNKQQNKAKQLYSAQQTKSTSSTDETVDETNFYYSNMANLYLVSSHDEYQVGSQSFSIPDNRWNVAYSDPDMINQYSI